MNQILELREKRAKAWDAAKAFLDSKRGADGMMSAEDAATYDRMEADVVNLGREVERLERQAAIDRGRSTPGRRWRGCGSGVRCRRSRRADRPPW